MIKFRAWFFSVKSLLWIPTIILAVSAIIVVVTLVTNNREDIADLKKKQQVITFVFNQGEQRFRIICSDSDSTGIYVCTTINLNASPSPSPRVNRSPGG